MIVLLTAHRNPLNGRSGITNSTPDCLEDSAKTIEHTSLQIAGIKKSKWSEQNHMLWFQYRNAEALWRWRSGYKTSNFWQGVDTKLQ